MKYFSRAKYIPCALNPSFPSLYLKYTCWKQNAVCIISKWLCLLRIRAFWSSLSSGCGCSGVVRWRKKWAEDSQSVSHAWHRLGRKWLWCVEGVEGVMNSGCWCLVPWAVLGFSAGNGRAQAVAVARLGLVWAGLRAWAGCTRAASPALWLLLPRYRALPAPNWVKGWTWRDYLCTEQGAALLIDWFALFNFWFSENAEVMTQWAMLRCNLEIPYIWWVVPSNTVWSEY